MGAWWGQGGKQVAPRAGGDLGAGPGPHWSWALPVSQPALYHPDSPAGDLEPPLGHSLGNLAFGLLTAVLLQLDPLPSPGAARGGLVGQVVSSHTVNLSPRRA